MEHITPYGPHRQEQKIVIVMAETKPVITPAEFLMRMKEIRALEDNIEEHVAGDKLLRDALVALGYGEGIALYDDIHFWYE